MGIDFSGKRGGVGWGGEGRRTERGGAGFLIRVESIHSLL